MIRGKSLYIQTATAKHIQPADGLFTMCILWNAVYRITYAHRCYIALSSDYR